jgi:UDP-N-acetylglucosamine 2-epimerase
LARFGLDTQLHPAIALQDLLDYGEFLAMLFKDQVVFTDGGGIQEVCAYLGKPCLRLRHQTE